MERKRERERETIWDWKKNKKKNVKVKHLFSINVMSNSLTSLYGFKCVASKMFPSASNY